MGQKKIILHIDQFRNFTFMANEKNMQDLCVCVCVCISFFLNTQPQDKQCTTTTIPQTSESECHYPENVYQFTWNCIISETFGVISVGFTCIIGRSSVCPKCVALQNVTTVK